MNSISRKQSQIKLLNRWWWPGQWLRIVWAVWVNQLWYWQNILPQLEGKRAASLFFQALLGGGLLIFTPALVSGLIADKLLIHINWELWFWGFLIGLLAAVMWGGAAALFNGANWGVSASAIFGIIYPFNASILIGTITHFPFPFTIFMLYGIVGGLFSGLGESLFRVIKQGKTLGTAMIIEHMAIYTLAAGFIAENVMVGVMTGLTYLLGTQIGRIWAIPPDIVFNRVMNH